MSIISEYALISRLTLLDRTNYSYWKTKMRVFIRALDMRAWRSILTGWTLPTMTDSEGKKVLEPEVDWSNDDCYIPDFR